MRKQFLKAMFSAVSLVAAAASIPAATASQLVQDNYCLQGRQSGYPGNCEFSTYRQCMATASGTNEGCGVNPMKVFGSRRATQQAR